MSRRGQLPRAIVWIRHDSPKLTFPLAPARASYCAGSAAASISTLVKARTGAAYMQ